LREERESEENPSATTANPRRQQQHSSAISRSQNEMLYTVHTYTLYIFLNSRLVSGNVKGNGRRRKKKPRQEENGCAINKRKQNEADAQGFLSNRKTGGSPTVPSLCVYVCVCVCCYSNRS
jgi:hypothetical protein